MKTKLILITFFALLASTVFAQTTTSASAKVVTANIKVYGNCAMCKDRIEKALDYKGIKQARWNVTTKNLEVVYAPAKITEKKIHELISAAGHDTDSIKANDAVYARLPFCCLYRDQDHSGMDDKKDNK